MWFLNMARGERADQSVIQISSPVRDSDVREDKELLAYFFTQSEQYKCTSSGC